MQATDALQLISSNFETQHKPARRGVLVQTGPTASIFFPPVTFTARGSLGLNVEDILSWVDYRLALDGSSECVPELGTKFELQFEWPGMPCVRRMMSKASTMTRHEIANAAAGLVKKAFDVHYESTALPYGEGGPLVQYSWLYLVALVPVRADKSVWRPLVAWKSIPIEGGQQA